MKPSTELGDDPMDRTARRRDPLLSLLALRVFLVTVVVVKVLAAVTSVVEYRRELTPHDLLFLLSADALVALVLLGLFAFGALLRRPGSETATLGRWTHAVVVVLAVVLTVFYALCGLLFYQWGEFLERRHVMWAWTGGLWDGVVQYLWNWTSVAILLSALAVSAYGIFRYLKLRRVRVRPRRLAVLALALICLATGAGTAIRAPYSLDPAALCPVVQLLRPANPRPPGLAAGHEPTEGDFTLPTLREVPAHYRSLEGVAQDRDLIIVVLESTRAQNMSLYGYARKTTPRLDELAAHALVFHGAYVNQPRTSKTMASLMLGVYPDPRARSITWRPERVVGQESLFGILADHGYRLYSGTTVGKDDDSFAQFLQNCTGDRLDRLIGREELGPASRTKGAWGNDLPLVDDFCEWYARQSGHTAALLWFAGPHWPYGAVFEPFGEERLVDRYDNGVYSSDVALDRLWEGIRRTGRRPLLVVFGDHGRALLEHVGDRGPGQYLYEVSVHVPCVFLGEDLFPRRLDLDQRFQIKDLPATLLFRCTA